jgi:hypothetical protein
MKAAIAEALRAPFPASAIKFRVGSVKADKSAGQALPYIDARDVYDRLDEVLGVFGWQCEHRPAPNGNGVMCALSIRDPDTGEWITKTDIAQQDSSKDDRTAEIAIKGAASDATKRAAVLFGIGRGLYSYKPQWVPLRDGKYFASTPQLPPQFLPKPAPAARAVKPQAPVQVAAVAAQPHQEPAGEALTVSTLAVTPDEFATLTDAQKRIVAQLLDRIAGGGKDADVRSYLVDGKGQALPEFARGALLKKLQPAA